MGTRSTVKRFPWPFKILALFLVGLLAALLFIGGAWERRLKAEYETAGAIRDLERYVRENNGKWPTSSAALGKGYRDAVIIDYSMSAERILSAPELLRDAVRPSSGKFRTYPNYEQDLKSLLKAIREAKDSSAP